MDLYIDSFADALIQLFEEAEQYIDAVIDEAMAHNATERSLLFWRRRAQAVNAELDMIRDAASERTDELILEAYQLGQLIARIEGLRVRGINRGAVTQLALAITDRLDGALDTVGRRVYDEFRRAGLRATTYHILAGTSQKQAMLVLERMLRRDSVRAFVDAAGREWNLSTYAKMVIKTTTREAVTRATHEAMRYNDTQLAEISITAKCCSKCLPYNGRTFALPWASSEVKRVYPVLNEIPPFHPECGHILGPGGTDFGAVAAIEKSSYALH